MLLAIIAAAGVVIPSSVVLAVVLMRETRRVHAFDRRLAISRTEALRLQPQGAADKAGRRGGRLFGELSVAAVRGLSPVGPGRRQGARQARQDAPDRRDPAPRGAGGLPLRQVRVGRRGGHRRQLRRARRRRDRVSTRP